MKNDIVTIDEIRNANILHKWYDFHTEFGRGMMCYLETMTTPGRARLPRRLKKSVKEYMRIHHLSSMVIMPQGQFVCLENDGRLLVCHTKY